MKTRTAKRPYRESHSVVLVRHRNWNRKRDTWPTEFDFLRVILDGLTVGESYAAARLYNKQHGCEEECAVPLPPGSEELEPGCPMLATAKTGRRIRRGSRLVCN